MKKFPLLLLLLTLLPFSANCQSDKNEQNYTQEPILYLALGDSYTIGTAINPENSYPHQLADSLQKMGVSVDTTQIIATNGWTTTDLKKGILDKKPDSSFNLVSLLIGVNNQYQGKSILLYKTEFRELLEQAIAFAGGNADQVFVVSIPNYGVTPFAESRNPAKIGSELIEYDRIAKEISTEYGITFINITPISELATDDLSLLASDELHPSAKMYSMWIGEILPTVTKILKE
jgi:lysophospholipase L1-like esterase